jgi:hypothetical protein
MRNISERNVSAWGSSEMRRTRGLLEITRLCECCGDAYAKATFETWDRWARRRFCSRECWWATRPNWNRYAEGK